MEILIEGKALDIATDFEIELEETNPFFTEQGSQSMPMTLPFTPHNLALLGNPHRIANTNKFKNEYAAVVRHSVLQKVGKLVVFSADKENGIDATFYLNDGDFYTQIKDVHLNQLDFSKYDERYDPDPFIGTSKDKAGQWITRFEHECETDMYAIFTVCTAKKEKTDEENPDGDKKVTYERLNEPDNTSFNSWSNYLLVGHTERKVDDVTVPVGYGITVFLKLNYLLHAIFAHFGYDLKPSLFDTDNDLKRLVVLNNTADTICSGKLNYQQLVPSCSVTTFLETLRNKFGCEFMPDSSTKQVTARFFEKADKTADMDLSPYVVGEPLITHEDFQQLKLTSGTGLEGAEPAAETFEELRNENDIITTATESRFDDPQRTSGEVILRLSTGDFYKQIVENRNVKINIIGSSFFDYNKKTKKLTYDERDAGDEQVPMLLMPFTYPSFGGNFTADFLTPFIGQRRHLNTGIKKKKDDEATEEKEGENKIMFCFTRLDMGRAAYFFGSTRCYNEAGEQWGSLSLQYAGESGIFVHYWKYYDALLRHAFRKVTCKLNMPIHELLRFNIFRPKLLNGVPVLPIRLKYRVGKEGLIVDEAEFRTLRLQGADDLEKEQEVPEFDIPNPYYWVRFDDAASKINPGDHIIRKPATPDVREYDPPKDTDLGKRCHVEEYKANVAYADVNNSHRYEITYLSWLEAKLK